MIGIVLAGFAMAAAATAAATQTTPGAAASEARTPAYGARLEGFDYAWPVSMFRFKSQAQDLEMAYLDVAPDKPNGQVAVLLHGKNFCAGAWELTIRELTQAGYRVVAPDQIGFCKSSKPWQYQYSFSQLSANTLSLLQSLKIDRPVIVTHSMGGMLALRHALDHPDQVARLVLINPIGLEDWKAGGVPWRSVDQWHADEQKVTAQSIRTYQKGTYYAGKWRPEFDRWVDMQAGMFNGPGKDIVAWSSALTYDMVLNQPVIHELERVRVPVSLMIGEQNNTAIGKATAPESVRGSLGRYRELGPAAVRRLPHGRLVTFPDLGHAPQIQAPTQFHPRLLEEVGRRDPASS